MQRVMECYLRLIKFDNNNKIDALQIALHSAILSKADNAHKKLASIDLIKSIFI